MSTRSRIGRATCLTFALNLGACAVGPSYHPPSPQSPNAYSESVAIPRAPPPTSEAELSTWWTQFNDPVLNELVHRALANNLDLQAAISRVRAARLQQVVARAAEYPGVSALGDAVTFNTNQHSTSAGSGTNGASGSAPSSPAAAGSSATLSLPSHLNLFAAGLDATWEVDFFGGTRRAVEAAKANTEAAVWARRDGEVTLVAEVANGYLTLRMLQARIAVGRAELERQKSLYQLVAARRQAGFVTKLDVNQQGTVVETVSAQIPELEMQAQVQTHAIAVLLGELPETLAGKLMSTSPAIPPPPPSLPTGLPSDLLRRRPDVREAERRIAAATAEVGVAEANRFPKLNLIGLASFASTSINELFSRNSFATAAVGMGSAPLFDAGQRRASVDMAKEQSEQASLVYRTAVLGAFRDVEDALARYSLEETRRQSLSRLVDAAQNSLTIAQDQYKTGLVTFINVLQAEITEYNARDQLIQSQAQLLTDLVALYKALGGGWSPGESAVPSSTTDE